ncbi:hypothetical protein G4G28_01890 [Massilia sp. Dwa41.01b]|uniref:hypothetical protein n=1 Tax=Massilia sp. Dwa41.01b TaxID=2709302 RepID=UPI001603AADE|nr:hypothetical protein [Massilia sp. Dwa41.01b]QNA87527.1 hypothetical protein G4G28_01890 [Massilia sp. Dwa41.01b]
MGEFCARGAEEDFRIASEGAGQAGVELRHRLRRLAGVEQGARQAHLVVGGRGQVEGALGLAHVASRIEAATDGAAGQARLAFDARMRQEHHREVHDAAQEREGKENDQPVQLAPLAHRVHGEEQGDEDVKSDS